jgi:hypothetical protein
MHKRILVGAVALLTTVVLSVGPVGWAAPLFQAQSMITYPTDGTTVSGQVAVRGVATHPNMDFYQVRYARGAQPAADSQWQDFAIVEGQQVQDEVLGTWDTTQIPDGQYTLALAVWGINDPNNPYVFFVTNLTVNNTNPVTTPTPEPSPTEPPPTATLGPTPTSVAVEQPATSTPRATPTVPSSFVPTPTAGGVEEPGVGLDVGRIRDGFCAGGLVTILLLSLWGLYLLAKAALRWLLRRSSESSTGIGR